MASEKTTGQVVTFHSYRGGSGRSTALANVACVLARRASSKRGVLMVDWDLQAPSLHWVFTGRLTPLATCPHAKASEASEAGLLELFESLKAAAARRGYHGSQSDEDAAAMVGALDLDSYIVATDIPGLHLMKAGRFGSDFVRRAMDVKWEEIFNESPAIFRAVAHRLASLYDFVLIDATSGIGDAAQVATTLMPSMLVTLFNLNHQSLSNTPLVLSKALEYRRNSDDLRPLVAVPVPSRVEMALPEMAAKWRAGETGYQRVFEQLFESEYALKGVSLESYFDAIRIDECGDAFIDDELPVIDQDRSGVSVVAAYGRLADVIAESHPRHLTTVSK